MFFFSGTHLSLWLTNHNSTNYGLKCWQNIKILHVIVMYK